MKNKACLKALLWLVIGAALSAIPLIYPQIGILQWVVMIPLFIGVYRFFSCENQSLWRAYRYGFLTVYVFYFVIYHWFVNLYPLDFVGMDNKSSLVVIAAAWLGLPLLQAVMGGFVFLLFGLLEKLEIGKRMPFARPFVFASLWVLFEFSSTIGWTGVPWGRLALGQVHLLSGLQSAALFGSYFVSWLILVVNGLLAYALLYRKKALVASLTAAVLLVSNFAYGGIVRTVKKQQSAEKITVAVIQGNMNSHDKWGIDADELTRDIYGRLTREAAAEGATLVVWPETAFPYVLTETSYNGRFVQELAEECNVTLVVGALHVDENDNEYNALFMIDPDGSFRTEVYAKRHLVPFGEYVPMRNVIMTLVPPLADLSALNDDLTPGVDSALFECSFGTLGSLICFDSIYESLTIDSVRDGAELMLISSNDSWFFDSAAVYQHQAHAQLRAIESGRDFVRAANTGISSVISADGSIKAWIDPLEEGYAVAEVSMRTEMTLYMRIGNLFVYLCAIAVLLLIAYGSWKTVRLKRMHRA
ncbi:MAG: apolipoprotein N-acyltransferase [Ruminococcaceae bacterium]|nr:apolipoprotein N-acyltransferase [Oscillospiraceae bacterium]